MGGKGRLKRRVNYPNLSAQGSSLGLLHVPACVLSGMLRAGSIRGLLVSASQGQSLALWVG